MAQKTIKFTYEGRDITLAYTRDIAARLESAGLKVNDIGDTPMTTSMMLYYGAFIKNHAKMKTETKDEIWEHIPNKIEFLGTLKDMYEEARDTLFEEPDEDDEKNVNWEADS